MEAELDSKIASLEQTIPFLRHEGFDVQPLEDSLGQLTQQRDATRNAKCVLAMVPEAITLGPEVVGMVAQLLAKHSIWIAANLKSGDAQQGDAGALKDEPMDADLEITEFDEIRRACRSQDSKHALEELCQRLGIKRRRL